MVTLIIIECLSALAIYLIARKRGSTPRPLTALLVLTPCAFPLAMQAWAMMFTVEPGSAAGRQHPAIVVDMITYLLYGSIPISLAVPVLAKGYRAPAAIFALPQIPLTWLVGFVGAMRVTGNWI